MNEKNMGMGEKTSEMFPKKLGDKMWRFRDVDGKYKIAAPNILDGEPEEIQEVREYREKNNMAPLEIVKFKDVQEEKDGTVTGVNAGGDRIIVLEANEK